MVTVWLMATRGKDFCSRSKKARPKLRSSTGEKTIAKTMTKAAQTDESRRSRFSSAGGGRNVITGASRTVARHFPGQSSASSTRS